MQTLSQQRRESDILWSKLIMSYGKRIWKVPVWFCGAAACFALVFYLYGLPLAPVLYASLLSVIVGSLLLGYDFWQYGRRFYKAQWLLSQQHPIPEGFLPPLDGLEEAYQTLSKTIYRDKQAAERSSFETYSDLMDYYTLWVHQIKTPIAAMNLLLQTQDDENSRAMGMELFKIEQYTDMVLQYLRLGSTSNDFVLQPYALDGMIRQALRKYAKLFIGRRIAVEFQETNCRVVTDEKWLVFVIEQLLSNALKYTNEGSIRIYANHTRSFTIEDTGIGISPEDLPRIFEKGYTGFNGRMDKKATGLGLYLCRKICEKLSHHITAESTPGAGTRMTVWFSQEMEKIAEDGCVTEK